MFNITDNHYNERREVSNLRSNAQHIRVFLNTSRLTQHLLYNNYISSTVCVESKSEVYALRELDLQEVKETMVVSESTRYEQIYERDLVSFWRCA